MAQDAMELVQTAAQVAGVSVSQFIREAAMMRALVLLTEEESASGVRQELAALREHIRTRGLARDRE